MRQISGNKLLVKALKEEGVTRAHAPLISVMNYIARVALTSSCRVMNRHLSMRQMLTQELQERSVSVW